MTISPTVESIEQAALKLQPAARAQLTHALVQSLASLPDAELWLAEAERRDTQMESGQVQGIPGDEVFNRLRIRYGK